MAIKPNEQLINDRLNIVKTRAIANLRVMNAPNVSDDMTIGQAVDKILEIPQGSDPPVEIKEIKVNYFYINSTTGEDAVLTKYYNKGDNVVHPEELLAEIPAIEGVCPSLIAQGFNFDAIVNIQDDYDIGVVYTTTDGKTYLRILITKTTGDDPVDALTQTLYFNKSNTATLEINWGDGRIDVSALSENQNISHTYAGYGNYWVTLEITEGTGTYYLGNGNSVTTVFGGNIQSKRNILIYAYLGSNMISTRYAFYNCWSLRRATIPNEVTDVQYVFYYVYSLTMLVIPNGVINITGAIGRNYILTKLSLPDSITSIGNNTYGNCSSLIEIRLPKNITSTNSNIFTVCYALKKVIIPENVTSFGSNIFSSCFNLEEVICKCNTIPTLASANFTFYKTILKIYVKDELYENWITATNWSVYADYIYPMSQYGG